MKTPPKMPKSGMLNGLGSILLESLWDVAKDMIEERRPPALVVVEVVEISCPALLVDTVTPPVIVATLPVGVGYPSCELCLAY